MTGIGQSWMAELAELRERFGSYEMGNRVGWGHAPALVVVDLQLGFTDPACPLGVCQDSVVASAGRLARAARASEVPVTYTLVSYKEDLSDAGIWPRKIPTQRFLVEGTKWVELDRALGREPDDLVLEKRQASAFFGTQLNSELAARGVDTLVVCGTTTSGCVRATVVDACGLGYHTIIVRDAVGDRHPLVHEVSLFDMDAKYGDVVREDDVVAAFAAIGHGRI